MSDPAQDVKLSPEAQSGEFWTICPHVHHRRYKADCAACIIAILRSASEAARKAALLEAAEWHEEQGEGYARRRSFSPFAAVHRKAAAHFRQLAERSEAGQGGNG